MSAPRWAVFSSCLPGNLLGVLGALIILLAPGCVSRRDFGEEAAQSVRLAYQHAAMGTQFQLVLFAGSAEEGEQVASAAFARIDALEAVATDYDPQSEARRLSETAGAWTAVSADLALVIRAADAAWRASGGAFDASLGHVTKLWRRALRQREWPSNARWRAAWDGSGWGSVGLRQRGGKLEVRLPSAAMRLDFGGVAKGVAVDEALAELKRLGVVAALLDGGGDLAALGPPPDATGWQVQVDPFPGVLNPVEARTPLRFVLVRGAIATSGDAYQSGELAGAPPAALPETAATSRFGHVLDPRTRTPLPGPRAAVMTAATAAEADALATALMVAGDNETLTQALRRGIFFGSSKGDPCVGELFPHDGVRLWTVPSPSAQQ